MKRWIVFDAATAAAVESTTNSRAELRDADAGQATGILAEVLSASGPAVAIVPTSSRERVLVIRLTRNARPSVQEQVPATPISGARVAPGGFLGLADELVLEDEPQPPKKWWQKILD